MYVQKQDAYLMHNACLPLQGSTKRRTEAIVQSLLPLEQLLSNQTYLVQDTLSLADILVAFDLKQPLEQVMPFAWCLLSETCTGHAPLCCTRLAYHTSHSACAALGMDLTHIA